MPIMTGSRFFAEAMRGPGVSHLFFVPTMMLPAAISSHSLSLLVMFYHIPSLVRVTLHTLSLTGRLSRHPPICRLSRLGVGSESFPLGPA